MGWFSMDRCIRELDLTANQKLVLMMLVTYTSPVGLCWPSIETLARDCALGRRTVIRATQALEAQDLIVIDRSPSVANRYTVAAHLLFSDGTVPQEHAAVPDRHLVPEGHRHGATESPSIVPDSPIDSATVAPEETHRTNPSKKPKRRKPPIVPQPSAADIKFEKIMNEWNEAAAFNGLPPLRKIPGPPARKKFEAREKDYTDFWKNVLLEILVPLDPFALGQNDRSWRLNFSYVCSGKVEKLLQGDWQAKQGQRQFTPQKGSPMAVMDEFNAMQDEIDRRNAQ